MELKKTGNKTTTSNAEVYILFYFKYYLTPALPLIFLFLLPLADDFAIHTESTSRFACCAHDRQLCWVAYVTDAFPLYPPPLLARFSHSCFCYATHSALQLTDRFNKTKTPTTFPTDQSIDNCTN